MAHGGVAAVALCGIHAPVSPPSVGPVCFRVAREQRTADAVSRDYPAWPMVGIGAIVLRAAAPGRPAAVLLVRRGRPPAEGQWSIPGGAQELGETAEAAARRELREETGVEVGPLTLAATVDSIHPDESGRIRFHYTILDFAALWQGGELKAGGDVTDAAFFVLDTLAEHGLWSEALRVIRIARDLLGV